MKGKAATGDALRCVVPRGGRPCHGWQFCERDAATGKIRAPSPSHWGSSHFLKKLLKAFAIVRPLKKLTFSLTQ